MSRLESGCPVIDRQTETDGQTDRQIKNESVCRYVCMYVRLYVMYVCYVYVFN